MKNYSKLLTVLLSAGCIAASPDNMEYAREVIPAAFSDINSLKIFAAGTIGTAALFSLERTAWSESDFTGFMPSELASSGDNYFADYWFAGALAGVMLYNEHDSDDAWPVMRYAGTSMVITGAATYSLKRIFHRTRPSGFDLSFPSGHTSAAFSTASVIHQLYGFKTAWPFWALAVNTGLSRINDNAHYPSDVAFGALLGIMIPYALMKSEEIYDTKLTYALPLSVGIQIPL